ncbi:MAG: ribosome biogenesis GTPase YlqF [Acidaminococcus sp.]|jgi:ribosome biogenesis GTPase A|nr:ribosome biogenesis GTPase YlqF [Acidaminococcus sp.]MCI2099950.1 ribosome biogenesis GTPase YlqF [Acidaminococcus sp.]MCI2114181.1 ribosome biogenesis GTPase YlqF [Acidaminococcus sp.]
MKELLEGYAFSIQWFPGHMTKARREMENQLKMVDVVVEMLDARIPHSSANPLLKSLIGQKVKIVTLNKTDMADPEMTRKWLSALKARSFTALEVDCQKGRGTKALLAAIRQAGQPVVDKWLKKGVRNHPIRVMIVGIPNVGKSTLINRLLGKNKTVTQNKPGVTRQTQWVEIGKGIELLDTPGVLWPKFEQAETGFNLAVTGAIKEDVYDRETAAAILVTRLMRLYPQQLEATYGITIEPEDTAQTVEAKIGKARGAIKAGGEINLPKTVDLILRDFKFGKIGPITLEEP